MPVIVAEGLTPEQADAYRIADNRTSDFTTWDYTALTEQLDDLAGDFSDVLGLQDWETVMGDYNRAIAEEDMPTSEEVLKHVSDGYKLTVVFNSERAAAQAMRAIVDMDGVVDVRDKRS